MTPRHFFMAPPQSAPRVPAPPHGLTVVAWAHDFPDS